MELKFKEWLNENWWQGRLAQAATGAVGAAQNVANKWIGMTNTNQSPWFTNWHGGGQPVASDDLIRNLERQGSGILRKRLTNARLPYNNKLEEWKERFRDQMHRSIIDRNHDQTPEAEAIKKVLEKMPAEDMYRLYMYDQENQTNKLMQHIRSQAEALMQK